MYLGFVRPHVAQFVEHVDFPKGAQHAAHQAGFAHGFLDGVEAVADYALCADDAGDARGDFAEHVESACDCFLARGHGVSQMLHGLEARVDDRHRYHPDTVLHTRRQCRHLGEDTLVGWASHDLVGVSLGSTVGANYCDAGTEVLDEVPAGPGDGEEIHVVADIAEDLQCGVVLEKQIHLDSEPPDILEHVRELHVLGVRAEAIKSMLGKCDSPKVYANTYMSWSSNARIWGIWANASRRFGWSKWLV